MNTSLQKPRKRKPVIGLVGGVGSGKSAAAAELAALGCAVIDADAIGHQVLRLPEVVRRVQARWGPSVVEHAAAGAAVNREALADVVFNDPAELAALNDIVWPHIGAQISERIDDLMSRPDVAAVVLDAAVMFEAGWDAVCTHLVFVDAGEQVRRNRAIERGMSERQWRLREKSQIPLDTKRLACQYTVDNSFSVSRLREQVRDTFRRILQEAEGF
jgi:dephospho-CoA kinase